MKLFQQLLVAPAALGLLSPVVVQAAELNIDGVNKYATEEQVTSISQFSDVKPTDWAYQALSNLIEKYGCVAGYPNGTYKGGQAMTRYEAAALLNACLDRITEVTDELKRLMAEFEKELAVLRGRVDGLEAKVGELEASQFSTTTKLNGKATFVIGANAYSGDAVLDLGVAERVLESVRPDSLTSGDLRVLLDEDLRDLRGLSDFSDLSDDDLRALRDLSDEDLRDLRDLSDEDLRDLRDNNRRAFDLLEALGGVSVDSDGVPSFSGRPKLTDIAASRQGATAFNYDIKLNFDTSFTGKDLFRTQLRAGNFADGPWAGGPVVGLNAMEAAFEENCGTGTDCGDVVAINRLFYQFPIGGAFTATIGGRVRQDDMLAVWPSAYPADTVLDIFTYAGAPGAYSLNLGAGGGIWWKSGDFSISANYVSANGDDGDPNQGGIGTDGAAQTGTVQIAYTKPNWGLAATYTYTTPEGGQAGLYAGNGTPLAVTGFALSSSVNSIGVSGYWQPSNSGWIPSISAGWGYNSYNADTASAGFLEDVVDGAESQSWYVGLQWDDAFIKGNALGMAVGQATFITKSGDEDALSPDDGNYAWEWWYKFQVTDNISVTPALYYLSAPLGQLQKGNDDSFNNFGGLIKTTFKF